MDETVLLDVILCWAITDIEKKSPILGGPLGAGSSEFTSWFPQVTVDLATADDRSSTTAMTTAPA